jgi:hypothetical protein
MKQKQLVLIAILSLSALIQGCGKQEYRPVASDTSAISPGTYEIPAKVDILLAIDDSGSAVITQDTINSETKNLMASIQASGWDYRITTTPLLNLPSSLRISASKYDANWGSSWIPPYPGATTTTVSSVNPLFFTHPDNYQPSVSITGTHSGSEPGLQTIGTFLTTHGSNFLRPDAMLVVFVISGSNDTSISPVSFYYSQILAAKGGDAAKVRVFSFVPNSPSGMGYASGACQGQPGLYYNGTRYKDLAYSASGQVYDFCQQSLQTAMNGLRSSLTAIRQNFRTKYLFIEFEPNPTSIVVTKYAGGNLNSPQVIPQDPVNGWTYVGNITDYAIDSPILMNLQTGFAVRLNGSAKLLGSDQASVEAVPLNP